MINKLQEGWDGIRQSNADNVDKARVSTGEAAELRWHINSLQAADVKLRQLKTAGELHYKVCETMEHVEEDITEMHADLEAISTSAGKPS